VRGLLFLNRNAAIRDVGTGMYRVRPRAVAFRQRHGRVSGECARWTDHPELESGAHGPIRAGEGLVQYLNADPAGIVGCPNSKELAARPCRESLYGGDTPGKSQRV
jgi:hypothetical protein